jgi:uncharacterized protein (TIGR02145 family)
MNKVNFIVIFAFAAVLSLLTGCGEEKVVEFGSLQQRGGVYVVPETQKPCSGKFVETRENVVIKAGSLKNGKLHGELTTYRKDGSIDKVETFAEDVLNGKLEKYEENGKLKLIENYKNGKIDGKRELYDENGKLLKIIQLGSFSDSRDGRIYATIKIGTQTWMAENLNYNASGSKCYGNDERNCQTYGRLYDWNTALKSCPSGWHLPTRDEWNAMEYEWVTMTAYVGGAEDDGNGTDKKIGFPALPLGFSGGSFLDAGDGGYWWNASKEDGALAMLRYQFGYSVDPAYWNYYYNKNGLFSVRCLQD